MPDFKNGDVGKLPPDRKAGVWISRESQTQSGHNPRRLAGVGVVSTFLTFRNTNSKGLVKRFNTRDFDSRMPWFESKIPCQMSVH